MTAAIRSWRLCFSLILLLAGSLLLNAAVADHGPEHTNPGQAIGVNGSLLVSPAIITNSGTANYTYTGEGYPSWDRFTGFHSLYYITTFHIGFRPVRWGTISLQHNCGVGDKTCAVDVRVTRSPGVDFQGEFFPNCRSQFYLGPFPATDGGGSRAQSRIALYVRGTSQTFNVQLINPLTVTATGRLPECPDTDATVPEGPKLQYSCQEFAQNVNINSVDIEIDDNVSGRVNFRADLYDFCEMLDLESEPGPGGDGDCDPELDPECFDGEGDAIEECVLHTDLRWNFGDGTILNSGSSDESHDYTQAGDYTVSMDIVNSPIGNVPGTTCELSLKPPGVRVNVHAVGTDPVVTPEGVVKSKASVGDAFQVNVKIETTDGFGPVEDLSFVAPPLLSVDSTIFEISESAALPATPQNFDANTVIFDSSFVVNTIGAGVTFIDAPVEYTSLGEIKQSADPEEVIVDAVLEVNLKTAAIQPPENSNRAALTLTVKNLSETKEFTKLEFTSPLGLSTLAVPGSTNPLGSASLAKSPGLPATIAAQGEFTGDFLVIPVSDGDVRLATTVIATDSDGNIFRQSKGADLSIENGVVSARDTAKAEVGAIDDAFEALQIELDELEADYAAMINETLQGVANGLGGSAAASKAPSACGTPGPGDNAKGTAEGYQKTLAEVEWLPESAANYVGDFLSDPDTETNPLALFLASKLGKLQARKEFVAEGFETLDNVGQALYDFGSKPEVREKFSREVVKTKNEFRDATDLLIYELFFTEDGVDTFKQTSGTAITNAGTAACNAIADEVKQKAELLDQGKYRQFFFESSQTLEKVKLEVGKEILVDAVGAGAANKVFQVIKASRVGLAVNRKIDAAKTAFRRKTRPWEEWGGDIPGKATPPIEQSAPGGGLSSQKKNRTTHDRPDANDIDSSATITRTLVDGPEFDGFIGGISPADQAGGMRALAKLEDANGLAPGTLSLDVTPTNPFASPAYRTKNGLQLVTAKEEVWKAKAISYDDFLLGAPREHLGELGVFKPNLKKYYALSKDEQKRLYPRLKKQQKNFYDATWTPTGTKIIDGRITRVDFRGKAKSELKVNMELATQPDGYTFPKNFPSDEFERLIPQKLELQRLKANGDRSETILWKDRSRPPLDPNRPAHPTNNPYPPFGGDMDGAQFVINGLENLPDHVRRNLLNKLNLEILPALRKEGLPFAQHHITKNGIDFLESDIEFMTELLIERLPEAKGRKYLKEFLDLKNKKTLLDAQRLDPNVTEQFLRDRGKWLIFEDEVEKFEFGVKLTRITRDNVAIVEGSGNPIAAVQRQYKRKHEID